MQRGGDVTSAHSGHGKGFCESVKETNTPVQNAWAGVFVMPFLQSGEPREFLGRFYR